MAGLIEGDGSFNVPKFNKNSKGKKNVVAIEIVGNIKDLPAYEFLRSKFGGYIFPGCL